MPDGDVTAALRYTGDGAPEVVAAGKGHVAASILARAREAGVPVHRDPELASALARLALGQPVPEAMWAAVAEVLAWAYGLSGTSPTRIGDQEDELRTRYRLRPSDRPRLS